jgi:manganese transport protein
VIVFATIGMIVYMEMSARVAVLSQRPVFSLIRERLGAAVALVDLVGRSCSCCSPSCGWSGSTAFSNFLGSVYLVVFVAISVAAIPLMIWTRMGA